MSDTLLEIIFANPNVQKMTCVEQSNLIDLIESILTIVKEEKPYATITELLGYAETE